MFKVRFKKVSSNHQRLRTDEIEGVAPRMPVVGESFRLFAEPIDVTKSARFVETSAVKSIVEDNLGFTVATENSVYRVELI